MRRGFFPWLACAIALASAAAHAQVVVLAESQSSDRAAVGLSGVQLGLGVGDADNAETAFVIGGTIGLGTVFQPWLHLSTGVSYWSADVDKSELKTSSGGTLSDLVFQADLRARAFRVWRLRPYVLAGLAAHNPSAEIPEDSALEDALSGFNLGADLGVGIERDRSGFYYGVEFRRRFVNDVDGWTLMAGIGWTLPPRYGRARPISAESATAVYPPGYPTRTPATAASASPRAEEQPDSEILKLTRLVQSLIDQNKTLRSELDSLRQARAEAAPPAIPAAPPPPAEQSEAPAAAPPPAPPPPGPRAELHDSLEQIAALSGQPRSLREAGDGYRLSLAGSFLFDVGRSDLQAQAREVLRRVALLLLRFPDVELVLEGHADAQGDRLVNQRLSQERAEAVRQEILALGVAPARLGAVGYGSDRPIADNTTAAGRAVNRRVELLFTPVAGIPND